MGIYSLRDHLVTFPFGYFYNVSKTETTAVPISSLSSLERSLNLKQLQISRILNITQAINNNVSEEGLYDMYKSFLTWELGVSKMGLFTRKDESWVLVSEQGIKGVATTDELIPQIIQHRKISKLNEGQLFNWGFELIVPVHHKEEPIAYVLIGNVKINNHDEIYNVIQLITTITNIIAVAIENKRLFKRQLEQQGLKKEMQLGKDMQQMLVPQVLPSNDKIDFDAIYLPKLSIGGDYFDCIEFKENRLAFCIGDISGKGIGAALLMANFQANFQSLIRQRVPLEMFIAQLNSSVNQITRGEKFITFFVAEINLDEGELRYVNAGHNPPILISDGIVQRLEKGCTILGSFDELPEIEKGVIPIKSGDMVVSFTDGLVEIKDKKDQFFSEDMLIDLVLEKNYSSAKEINRAIKSMIDQFNGSEDYPDDFTLFTCEIK